MPSKTPPITYEIPQNSKRKGTITFIAEYRDMKSDEIEEIDKRILGCVLSV